MNDTAYFRPYLTILPLTHRWSIHWLVPYIWSWGRLLQLVDRGPFHLSCGWVVCLWCPWHRTLGIWRLKQTSCIIYMQNYFCKELRGIVKDKYLVIILGFFSYFSICFTEALLWSTHNIYFYGELEKIIP